MIIINPGSENTGGTFQQALKNARRWHRNIKNEFPEVVMTYHENKTDSGNWNFRFRHTVAGVGVDLSIHGFTEKECNQFVFKPRVYWNGSSTADPQISDWLNDDYTYRIVYTRKPKKD